MFYILFANFQIFLGKMSNQSDVSHSLPSVDMINAISKLQLEAAEIRSNKPNWNSYLRLTFLNIFV